MKSEIAGITRANEGCREFPGISSARPTCRRTAPSIPSPGTRHCRPAPSCRRISIRTRTSISTCWKASSLHARRRRGAGDAGRSGPSAMGVPHGIFNKSDQTAKVLFWVSPTRQLYDLFWGHTHMKEQKPEDVVAMAAEHNIHFLPPPPGRKLEPAPPPRRASAPQNPPWRHSRARWPRAGRGSAPFSIWVKPSGASCSTASITPRPARRFERTMSAVIGRRFCSYATSA